MTSVIFIGSSEKNQRNFKQSIINLFAVSPHDVIFRIFAAFMPPIFKNYKKVYVDLFGPLLALVILVAFVNYGNSLKVTSNQFPTEIVLIYSLLMPVVSYILCKIGNSSITVIELFCVIGYGFYGHIFTLLLSFLCFQERSNFFFFVCLIFFGGLSTLRITLVILKSLPIPAARLLICSTISVANILFVIFIHFTYMHRTFRPG